MSDLYIINELTALRLIWHAARGGKPKIISVEAYFPPLQSRLRRLAERLVRNDRASWFADDIEELHDLMDYPPAVHFYDIFGRTEDWQEEFFELKKIDQALPDYAMSVRHVVTNHLARKHFTVLAIKIARERHPQRRITGIGRETGALYGAYPAMLQAIKGPIGYSVCP